MSRRGAPLSLVDRELTETVIAGILIRFGDNPSWIIGDTRVKDFAGSNHIIE
jgi:hypothetical protein